MLVGGLTTGAISNLRTADPVAVAARPEAAGDARVASHVYVPARPIQQAAPSLVETAPRASRMSDIDDAHRTAWSALNNDRFRLAMEKLADVATADAVMMLRPVEGSGTDIRSALTRYEENS